MGQTVAAGSDAPPLFLVAADATVINVEVNAGENGIGEIKPGDKATFTVEAFPERSFAGEVAHIRPSPRTIENAAAYDPSSVRPIRIFCWRLAWRRRFGS